MSTEESPLLGDRFQPNANAQRNSPTKDIYDRFNHEQKRVIVLAIISLTGLVPSVSCISIRPFFSVEMALTSTFGCSGSDALGVAAIGDIYKVEERGTAMGIFLGVGLPAIMACGRCYQRLSSSPRYLDSRSHRPSEYWSWRGFQAALGVWGIIQILLHAFFFPEIAHPGSRGIDRLRGPKKLFVWINPFRRLSFLRSPNIMAITLSNTCALISDYALLIPIAYTVVRSEIRNHKRRPGREAKEERKGIWVPEDRLRAVWLGGLVLVPLSVTLSGFTTAYVDGMVGTSCGHGSHADWLDGRFLSFTYIRAFRALLIAPVSALTIPSGKTIGVAATNSVAGILALLSVRVS
ncbi:hypothetical protein OG21DRAFT_1485197 [Imleria badia]|nr:hypothetical protein OG21DRAFT_1485197 [Imleria badia]